MIPQTSFVVNISSSYITNVFFRIKSSGESLALSPPHHFLFRSISVDCSHELTQEQLASQSGLSISALQKYESDERKPKPEQLLKISDALGMSINIFMDFDIRTVSDLFSLLFRMEEQANS